MIKKYSHLAAMVSGFLPEEEIQNLPIAKEIVSGLEVLENIDNTDSISASLNHWEILDYVREIPMSLFDVDKPTFYSVTEEARVQKLANSIKTSKTISPLIVVFDAKGPYVLEGGHRYDALLILKIPTFPAMVVIDREEIPE